jgi:hypothetical protein
LGTTAPAVFPGKIDGTIWGGLLAAILAVIETWSIDFSAPAVSWFAFFQMVTRAKSPRWQFRKELPFIRFLFSNATELQQFSRLQDCQMVDVVVQSFDVRRAYLKEGVCPDPVLE